MEDAWNDGRAQELKSRVCGCHSTSAARPHSIQRTSASGAGRNRSQSGAHEHRICERLHGNSRLRVRSILSVLFPALADLKPMTIGTAEPWLLGSITSPQPVFPTIFASIYSLLFITLTYGLPQHVQCPQVYVRLGPMTGPTDHGASRSPHEYGDATILSSSRRTIFS